MIYVEWQIIDHRTMQIAPTKLKKEFTLASDFNKWYTIMKKDDFSIVNVMMYNPNGNPEADINYLKLLQANAEQ